MTVEESYGSVLTLIRLQSAVSGMERVDTRFAEIDLDAHALRRPGETT